MLLKDGVNLTPDGSVGAYVNDLDVPLVNLYVNDVMTRVCQRVE